MDQGSLSHHRFADGFVTVHVPVDEVTDRVPDSCVHQAVPPPHLTEIAPLLPDAGALAHTRRLA